MNVTLQAATIQDLRLLLRFIRDFYELEHLTYDEKKLNETLTALIRDESLGRVWIIRSAGDDQGATEEAPEPVGYMVVGFGFSLEYYGQDALLDEFYIEEAYRGMGIGEQALNAVVEFCRARGIRALHLEVDWINDRARNLYSKKGFQDHKRHLMTKWID